MTVQETNDANELLDQTILPSNDRDLFGDIDSITDEERVSDNNGEGGLRPLRDEPIVPPSFRSQEEYLVYVLSENRRITGEVTEMKRKCELQKIRLETFTLDYVERSGRGKNRFIKNMKKLDDINSEKISRVVNDIVAPNEMILREGWDSWSEDGRTFCQKFINKSEVMKPSGYNDMANYWRQYIAPMINYCMGNKRNNLHQIVKRTWMSKMVCGCYQIDMNGNND